MCDREVQGTSRKQVLSPNPSQESRMKRRRKKKVRIVGGDSFLSLFPIRMIAPLEFWECSVSTVVLVLVTEVRTNLEKETPKHKGLWVKVDDCLRSNDECIVEPALINVLSSFFGSFQTHKVPFGIRERRKRF